MMENLGQFKTLQEYKELEGWLDSLKVKSMSSWADAMRDLCKTDLYFLHRYVLSLGSAIHSTYGTPIYENQVYVDAARQYERHLTYGSSLDCSARRSGKSEWRSTTIPIQLMLNYPDISIFILSVKLELATKHLRRLMNELERNKLLLWLFDDVLWTDPREMAKNQGLTWSINEGICIKGRKINRSINTVEIHALIGGGPIGTGPDVIVADDIERRDKVSSPEAIEELDKVFSESVTLLTPVVVKQPLLLVSNTKFAQNGLIQRLDDRYTSVNPDKVRSYAAENNTEEAENEWEIGPLGGKIQYPFTKPFLQFKFEESEDKSEYGLQYALRYDISSSSLNKDRIVWYDSKPTEHAKDMNVYICIDASRGKIDPTAIWVWGLTPDKRKVWLDGIVKKIDPATPEFHDEIRDLVMKWQPLCRSVIEIRVEDTPNSTWAELISKELVSRGIYTPVIKVKVYAHQANKKFKTGKADRIYARWAPMLNRGEVWFPKPASAGGGGIWTDDEKGKFRDIVDYFLLVELKNFPASKHDDMLDAGGLIEDEKTNQERPLVYPSANMLPYRYTRYGSNIYGPSWMSA